jgi:hypothetical protein
MDRVLEWWSAYQGWASNLDSEGRFFIIARRRKDQQDLRQRSAEVTDGLNLGWQPSKPLRDVA